MPQKRAPKGGRTTPKAPSVDRAVRSFAAAIEERAATAAPIWVELWPGDLFQFAPMLPPAEFERMILADPKEVLSFTERLGLLRRLVNSKHREALEAALSNPDKPIPPAVIYQVTDALAAVYLGGPTQPPAGSDGGRPNTGEDSGAGASTQDSTPSTSHPATSATSPTTT